MLTGDVIISVG